jgi:NAD(P)-dependent dehydrogenase (short-subunit alcohol dehydrogenase family)
MSKVVLITGAARGIGAATALCAAREGYSVAVNYRSNADRAEQIVREIRALGPRAVAIQADTSQEADVVRLFREAQEELGPLDALVNNAGVVGSPGPS